MFWPFRALWFALASIAGLSLLVLGLQAALPGPVCVVEGYSFPWSQCLLGDSTRTPWGIFTAFFVHASFVGHFLPNMVLLFAVVLVFCVTNALLSPSEKRLRGRVFLEIMFLAGVVGNGVSLLLYGPIPSIGASGLDFAALGITMVFCLVNVFPTAGRAVGPGGYYRDPLNAIVVASNGALAVGLFFLAVSDPAAFLSSHPGVDVVTHLVSFLFALGAAAGWLLTAAPRRSRWPKGALGS